MQEWIRIKAAVGSYATVEGTRVFPLRKLPTSTSAGNFQADTVRKMLKTLLVGAKWPVKVGYATKARGKEVVQWVSFDEILWIQVGKDEKTALEFANLDQLEGAISWCMIYSGVRRLFLQAVNVPKGSKDADMVNRM